MSGFNGKWKSVASENVEAFFNAVNAPEDLKDKLRALAAEHATNPDIYIEELKVDTGAGTVQRIVHVKGEVMIDTGAVKFGVEHDDKAYGKPAKVVITLESPNKIVKKEHGADFSSTHVLEVSGNQFTITMTCGSVVAKETYARA